MVTKNSQSTFLKNLAGFSMVTWISFILSFLSTPISTRIYTPDIVGRINLFSLYSSLLMAFTYLGLDQAYVRFYNEPPLGKSSKILFTFCLFSSIFALIIIGAISFIFSKRISFAIAGENSKSLFFLLLLNALSGVITRFINLRYRMSFNIKWYTIQGIVDVAITKILYLAVGFWNPSYKPAIFFMTISRILVTFTFLLFQRKEFEFKRPTFLKVFTKEIVNFALPLVPVTFLSWANNSISQIVLQNMLGFSKLGVYSIAVGLASIISIIQAGFNTYWAPYIYQNYRDKDNKFWQIHKLIVASLTLLGVLIILLQDPIFLLIGEKYRQAKIFFPLLLISPICYTMGETTGLGINISKKTFWELIIFSINIVMNISLCLVLIPIFGIVGAALSSAITSIISLFLRTIVGEKFYRSINSYKYIFYGIITILSASIANYVLYDNIIVKYSILAAIALIDVALFKNEIVYMYNIFKGMFNLKYSKL